jgi:hypothetical protein
MATDRQIAANRKNAQKSTGPRFTRGKKRASRNALRHGLTKPHWGAEFEREAERLARQLAGESQDDLVLQHAREAAHAELEVRRVRSVAVAQIERASAFGRFDVAKIFRTRADEAAWAVQFYLGGSIRKAPPKFAIDPLPPMPPPGPARTAEAVRRALPTLARLARYEARAIKRRDRAIQALVLRKASGPIQL